MKNSVIIAEPLLCAVGILLSCMCFLPVLPAYRFDRKAVYAVFFLLSLWAVAIPVSGWVWAPAATVWFAVSFESLVLFSLYQSPSFEKKCGAALLVIPAVSVALLLAMRVKLSVWICAAQAGLFVISAVSSILFVVLGKRTAAKKPEKAEEKAETETPEEEKCLMEQIGMRLSDIDDEMILRMIQVLDAPGAFSSPDKEYSLREFAMYLGTNRTTLSCHINRTLGYPFTDLINFYHVKAVMRLYLHNPDLDMETLARKAGYANYGTFYNHFERYLKTKPKKWRDSIKQIRSYELQTQKRKRSREEAKRTLVETIVRLH